MVGVDTGEIKVSEREDCTQNDLVIDGMKIAMDNKVKRFECTLETIQRNGGVVAKFIQNPIGQFCYYYEVAPIIEQLQSRIKELEEIVYRGE